MTTTAPMSALITLSSPNCLVETANWLSIGRTSSESSFPVRTSSGTLATLVKKNAWNNCAMIWCVPTSSTTSHFVQSPIWSTWPKMMLKNKIWPQNQSTSTIIQRMKLALKLISRMSELRSMIE